MKRRRWNAIKSYAIGAIVVSSAIVGVVDVLMLLKS